MYEGNVSLFVTVIMPGALADIFLKDELNKYPISNVILYYEILNHANKPPSKSANTETT